MAPDAPAPDPRPDSALADPAVAGLQRRAASVQTELAGLQAEVHAAQAALAEATATRERADTELAALRSDMDRMARAAFADSATPSTLRVLLTADSANDFLDGVELLSAVQADLQARIGQAVRVQRAAANAEQDAADRHTKLDAAVGGARERAHAVAAEMNTALAQANDTVVAMQRNQQELNERTAANWRAYTDRLRGAGIVAPPAAALRDPTRLPAGLQPLPGTAGAQAGVALALLPDGTHLLVLPAETLHAVTLAMATLGRPYTPGRGGEGPAAYSCDGLVRAVFGQVGLRLGGDPAAQLATLQPVAPADAQPGDLVFAGPAADGVQHVGIALDAQTMLGADARLAGVAVTGLPSGDALLGVARPALAPRPPAPVPARTAGGLPRRCNGVVLPPAARGAGGAWGGFPNGMIPTAALCPVAGAHRLRCDATLGYQAMSAAFTATFGRTLCLGSSYRPYDAQVQLYAAKPALAAVPGTSNHGWGLAVDLCGGAESFGTPEYAWLAANGRAFGWINPPWALPGRGREEPWHWEFVG